ncbi:uncharacterized protein LOC122577441 isoform X13 [Bombus pyrosoma]|uniref:uncharacterized protein LOC122577441 isoform X13 n=1 Tax=Bombus pyrosoma TaxID=396416 RepID=UPI001CB9A819|nr:uncharacterized protein LOC122577441 isoform X13 [Bombus pyrosoma]XP_043604704.1 uncharacterized protein LOC122577441 isoform X13 [Bombus pyrosoma]
MFYGMGTLASIVINYSQVYREDDPDDCAKACFLEETSTGILDILLSLLFWSERSSLYTPSTWRDFVLVIMILNGEYRGVFVKGSLCRLSCARRRWVPNCVSGPRKRSQRVKCRGQERGIV